MGTVSYLRSYPGKYPEMEIMATVSFLPRNLGVYPKLTEIKGKNDTISSLENDPGGHFFVYI